MLRFSLTLAFSGALVASTFAYDFLSVSAGRNDRASIYDLAGTAYPNQANVRYQFGKFGAFNALPQGVQAAWVTAAITAASTDWSKWGKFDFDSSGLLANGAGLVRLNYDPNINAGGPLGNGAYMKGYGFGGRTYAEITFGKLTGSGSAWTQENFSWTMEHEMGHMLGLSDLYNATNDEFVDRKLNSLTTVDKTDASYQDNIMNQYNAAGNDYTQHPSTVIDNDEVAGLTWLWGSGFNQIVTGKLSAAYQADGLGRGAGQSHGQQTAGTWTYRGSFNRDAGSVSNPFIEINFPGYVSFTGTTFGATTPGINWVSSNGTTQRFEIQEAGWTGNFVLNLKSTILTEANVDVTMGVGNLGRDFFTRAPDTGALVNSTNIAGATFWAQPMGPAPEPSSVFALALGIAALLMKKRRGTRSESHASSCRARLL